MGSRVHVQSEEGGKKGEVIGTVTSAAHGWFTVELPGRAQVRARDSSCLHHPLPCIQRWDGPRSGGRCQAFSPTMMGVTGFNSPVHSTHTPSIHFTAAQVPAGRDPPCAQ